MSLCLTCLNVSYKDIVEYLTNQPYSIYCNLQHYIKLKTKNMNEQ